MSRLSWQNDPNGCFEDWLNEQTAEALHATHKSEHQGYPQKDCMWCEAERKATEDDFIASHSCPKCGELIVPAFYCIKCGYTPDWKAKENKEEVK